MSTVAVDGWGHVLCAGIGGRKPFLFAYRPAAPKADWPLYARLMALELSLDGLAAVSLFVANVVVGVVAIGTYWRMTRYEQSNHLHIVNALRETRDAGREAKIATRELLRMVERQEQGRGAALQASDLEALRELPQLLRLLLEGAGREGDDGARESAQRLHWPDSVQELNQEGLDQLKRSHRNEVDRMLAQRRHLQMELAGARERLEENARVLNSFRSRTSQSLQSQVELSGARQQLEQTRANMLQLQDKLAQMETRADKAERNVARLQRDLEEAALRPGEATAQAQTEQASRETLLGLEREAQAQRDQLADAERTIQKLRRDLEILAADPPDHGGEPTGEPGHDQARARLDAEVEQLKARVDDLQEALRRNVVEKEFIEEHYLAETRKRLPPAEP